MLKCWEETKPHQASQFDSPSDIVGLMRIASFTLPILELDKSSSKFITKNKILISVVKRGIRLRFN